MKEASKAHRRRMQEQITPGGLVWDDVFSGSGIDVGCADDKLPLENCIGFDKPDGSGDSLLAHFKEDRFAFVHGSQVLEHAQDPRVMLQSWIDVLHRGGYVVATVPDFELYEHCIFPSKWNDGHRSTWSTTIPSPIPPQILSPTLKPIHCKLPQWLYQFPVDVVLCRRVDTNYDYSVPPSIDQTFDYEKGVEAFIEFVLRKL